MGEPGGVFAVGSPIPRRALDAFYDTEEPGVFRQSTMEQAPLPQQRLVRRLDRMLARVFSDIGGEPALLDKMQDQWQRLGGNFREPSDAPSTSPIWVMITASSKSPRAESLMREKAMAPQLVGSVAMTSLPPATIMARNPIGFVSAK